ncbi:serine/threonine protein kinase [Corallococcus sp. ZKHCc1 1396]|uniref:Serine/threonine protein kinase n=1 Tax=Corallococcus soli TaxID=2710757 RepID=A0ABR9PFZ4_9BACT|nr:serine/threonine protein kinase [Corallococcus soli]MBE4746831.1 serine/threonine protein kinase [Corallococcus soli]
MVPSLVIRSCSLLLLGFLAGCATTAPGNVSVRSDGTPEPEACSEEALKAMRILGLQVSDGATMEFDVNQADTSPVYLREGPIESELNNSLGPLYPGTLMYGRIWTGGTQVVIRYYEAKPPDRERLPLCAVARSSKGQLRKMKDSKPGMATMEFSGSGVYIVDGFR